MASMLRDNGTIFPSMSAFPAGDDQDIVKYAAMCGVGIPPVSSASRH